MTWNQNELESLLVDFKDMSKEDLEVKYGRSFNSIKIQHSRLISEEVDTNINNRQEHAVEVVNDKIVSMQARQVSTYLFHGYDEINDIYLLRTVNGHFIVCKKNEEENLCTEFKNVADFNAYLLNFYNLYSKADIAFIRNMINRMLPTQLVFDPTRSELMYETSHGIRMFNSFRETKYMRISRETIWNNKQEHLSEEQFKQRFPHINAVLMNLIEDNYEYVKVFLDYIAAITHLKKKLGTIIVFRGLQGAGKNAMVENLLQPLFSDEAVKLLDGERIAGKFNKFLEGSFLVVLDEMQHEVAKMNNMSEKIKSISTAKTLEIEKKGIDSQSANTYFNFFMFSNEKKAVKIDIDDRRFYVFATQEKIEDRARKIFNEDLNEFWKNVKAEVDSFLTYVALLKYNYNNTLEARILNDSKIAMSLGTNTKNKIFFKILEFKKFEYMQWLFKELIEMNAENEFLIEELRERGNIEKARNIMLLNEKSEINEFFKQCLKGRISTSLMHKVYCFYLSNSIEKEVLNTTRIRNTVKENFPKMVKIMGYHYYSVGMQVDKESHNGYSFEDLLEIQPENAEKIFDLMEN